MKLIKNIQIHKCFFAGTISLSHKHTSKCKSIYRVNCLLCSLVSLITSVLYTIYFVLCMMHIIFQKTFFIFFNMVFQLKWHLKTTTQCRIFTDFIEIFLKDKLKKKKLKILVFSLSSVALFPAVFSKGQRFSLAVLLLLIYL